MATHLYVTPSALKASTAVPDELADDDVERALSAASGAVEELAHRKFWLDPEPVVRRYTAMTSRMVVVDDVAFIDSVTSDGSEIATYHAEPLNANVDGKPFLWLVSDRHAFSTERGAISVTGRFGWPEIPDQVPQLVSIIAARLVKRAREAPFGLITTGMEGSARTIAREDPEAATLLRRLTRSFPVVA